MGTGIWAMHYVGMLAYQMPMEVLYDWPTVVASMLAAVVASGVSFLTVARGKLSWRNTLLSGCVMGGGIAAMHYLGMAAMRMPARVTYSPPLVMLSVLAAVLISVVALRLTFEFRDAQQVWSWKKGGSALLMGMAIPTMHYLGMAAAGWEDDPGFFAPSTLRHAVALSEVGMVSVILVAVLVLALALLLANIDRRVSQFQSALHGSRRHYEQLLGHNERLQSAFRAGGVGIWECDPATSEFYVDASLRDLYGVPHDGRPVARKAWRAKVHPDDARAVDEQWVRCLAAGDRYENEYRIVRPDGEIRRVRSVASIMRTAEGMLVRVLGMTWDVTGERRREQETEDLAERFRMTLESIGDAVISTDEAQRVIFLNRAASQLTGWDPAEAMGKLLEEVVVTLDERTDKPRRDPVQRCIESGGSLLAEDGVLVSLSGTRYNIRKRVALMNQGGAAVLTFQDITASRRMERNLQYAATHDALTGMANRAAFEQELRTLWEKTQNSAATHCLCMVDLDRFKIINDTSGHLAGDALLREIANVLRRNLQPEELAARMGGDEFLLLLRDCTLDQGEKRVGGILEDLSSLRFPWEGRLYDITASSGLVHLDRHSPEPEMLVSQADVATFTAKRNGRNQVSAYRGSNSDASGAHQEMEIVAGLRRSLEENRFELHAQPIVPVASPDVIQSFELLIRMRDANGTLISPGVFVPAAERYGLMGMVDRWVIRTALESYKGYAAHGIDLSFAINLSAGSIDDPSLWEFVAEQLARTGVPAKTLTFEVTETGLIENFDQAKDFVKKAREAGCRIALDDFGTGLSSLSYLKQFALDVIKIDGTFIKTLQENSLDQAIIRSVAEIARSMNAVTVAECVEELSMLEMLSGLGIDFVQGWATGKPQPLAQVLDFLARQAGATQGDLSEVGPRAARLSAA